MHRLSPLPERLNSENQHIRALLDLLGAQSPSFLPPCAGAAQTKQHSDPTSQQDPERVHELASPAAKATMVGKVPGRCGSTALGKLFLTSGRRPSTRGRGGAGGVLAMACQPAAVAGSAAASGQLVVINGEGAVG
jgi:hypothetical protein